jgi:hypothetical protein
VPRPTTDRVIPLARALYARHGAGCCLHLVLDDGNYGDDIVESCERGAAAAGHADCLELAGLLRQMSKTQRGKVAKHAHRSPA